MKIQTTLDNGLLKAIALKQELGESYFIHDGKAFSGEKDPDPEDWEEISPIEDDEERDNHIVLTDEEADEKAKEYILDTLWAFNPDFLSDQTGLDPEIFQAIADNGKCESNNDIIHNTISKLGDIDDFVQAAISADGRGHFINSYDGEEREQTVEGETFYIYRIN